MSGIYVHIPFCKSKCWYCDFYSVTKPDGRDEFASLLLEELSIRIDYLPNNEVDTIYFGGGTPTLLPPDKLNLVLNRLSELFQLSRDAEITIEANPDDLNSNCLQKYRSIGFNRISIGTQSFFDHHLKAMNRRHNAAQAIEAIQLATAAGFDSISIDLIYGIPGMTMAEWQYNLQIACQLPVGHLSAYHLTIEPGTRFGKLKKAGLFAEIADEKSVEQYKMLLDITAGNGFEQYEISNFARNRQFSRHNSKYWMGESYLGLGPSAHSFNGSMRHWNPSSLAKYAKSIREGILPAGETIDPVMHRNEYIMTRLRTAKGIGLSEFETEFGNNAMHELLVMAEKHIRSNQLLLKNERLFFDKNAWFRSDGILSDLFLIT
jgi:oxygen-independent coproporphyrinogen III oxidase